MSKTLKAKLKKNDREREYDDIYAMYGDKYNFSNYAFPLYLFIKRLYERFISEGGKDLLFCSREGQFLKKLLDTYCDHHGYKVNTHYLYASRNSVLLAGLKPIKDEDFYYIKNSASTMNTSIFCIPYRLQTSR